MAVTEIFSVTSAKQKQKHLLKYATVLTIYSTVNFSKV